MGEGKRSPRGDLAVLLQHFEVRVPGDLSERQHRLWPQNRQFALKVVSAIHCLLRQGLICRRRATHGGRDIHIFQAQSIVPAHGSRLIRKAGTIQSLMQKIARAVTGKDAPRPISSMRRRSQPQNKELRRPVAKPGHASAPVVPLAIPPTFFPRHFFSILHKPRTLPARAHLFRDELQFLALVHGLPLRMPARTTAWFCFSSFLPNSNVTFPCSFSSRSISASNSFFFASSARYRFSNSGHLSGSFPYHPRNASLGAISFIHKSTRARTLVRPRGQSRSTSMR